MSGAPGSAAAHSAGTALLLGGGVPGTAAGLAVTVASVVWGGGAAVSAFAGAVLGTAAFAVGPLLLRRTASSPPPAVMALALTGYLAVASALGLAYLLLDTAPWLSGAHAAAGLLATTLGWLGGLLRAAARLRVPAFDVPLDAPGSAVHGPVTARDAAGRTGRPPSPPQAPR